MKGKKDEKIVNIVAGKGGQGRGRSWEKYDDVARDGTPLHMVSI